MSHAEAHTQTITNIAEPPMFRIIYVNDDVTTVEFVASSLIAVFKYTPETAEQITWDVHANGSAVVAVLPYELAEQKGAEVLAAARENQYPLQVRLEPDLVE